MLISNKCKDINEKYSIIDAQLEQIKLKYSKRDVELVFDRIVRDFILCKYVDLGQRAIIAMINQNIEDPLAEMVLPVLGKNGKRSFHISAEEQIRITEASQKA